jgi:hypothetical protein
MTDHDAGYVRPLPPEGAAADVFEPPPPPEKRRRGLIIGGAVVGVLAAGALGAAVAWTTLVGSAFASAEAVPADADFVVTFDLLQVRDSEPVDRLIKAFTRPAARQGMIEDGEVDVLSEIDEAMEREIGLTVSDDVIPWIGRSVSLALWIDGNPASPDFDEDDFGGVWVSGVRDQGAAAEFVRDLAKVVARETGGSIESSSVGGGDLTIVRTGDPTVEGLFAYLDSDLMILGIREGDVQRALAARDGGSILEHDGYQEVIAALPDNRLVAGYMDVGWVEDMYRAEAEAFGPQAGMVTDMIEAYDGFGMALTLHDAGVAFDGVALVDPAAEPPIDSLDAADLVFPSRLPDQTLVMAAAPLPEDAIAEALDSIRNIDPGIYDDAMSQVTEIVGFDLVGDVLPHLGREVVLAMVTTPDGLLARQTNFNIGGVFGIGVTDADVVSDAVARLEDVALDNGLVVRSLGAASVVEAEGQEAFAYGLSEEDLVFGTGPTVVEVLLEGSGSSLDDNPRYAQLDGLLPGTGLPVFVDLQGLFDAFEWNGPERSIADPLQAIGFGGEVSDRVVGYTMFVLIDY